MNNMSSIASVYTAEKGTPGSPGTAYLKLTSKMVGPAVMNGVAVSGVLDSMTMMPKSGFAFAQLIAIPDNVVLAVATVTLEFDGTSHRVRVTETEP